VGAKAVVFGLLVSGCGRFGFDPPSTPPPDDPDASPVTPTIQCGSPARFEVNAAQVDAFAAAPLPNGFAIFTINPTGVGSAWSYEWGASGLAPTAQNIDLGTNISTTLAATSIGTDLLFASVVGPTTPTGTRMTPLGPAMAKRGTPVTHAEIGGMTAIAKSGTKDEIAFVSVDDTTLQVDARHLTTLGPNSDAAKKIVDPAERAGAVTIASAHTGYIVTWQAAMPSPNEVHAVLVDDNFNVVAGPIAAVSSTFDPIRPRIAWASASNRYLFAWHVKNVTNDDEIWVQLRDDQLAPITTPLTISPKSYDPQIATDGTDFWVTWRSYASNPEVLETSKITSTGGVIPKTTVISSGGTPKVWATVERAGQAVLVWVEEGGAGPALWLNAMCP
jgi:hypothetical protein